MRTLTPRLAARAQALREEGYSAQAIAETLGVPRRMVFREIGRPAPKAKPIASPLPMMRGPGPNPSTPADAPFKVLHRDARSVCAGRLVWPSSRFGPAQAVGLNPVRYVPYRTPKQIKSAVPA